MGNVRIVRKNSLTQTKGDLFMKKRLLGIFFLSATIMLAGCSNSTTETTIEPSTDTENTSEVINIVATSFYEYDWLKQIIGEEEGFSLSFLIDNGVDLHSYEPTVEDITNIAAADLFIYNGGESDSWVDDILATTTVLNTINVIEVLDDNVQMEVLVEGMEASDHDHDHEDAEEEDHDHDEDATEEDHDHDEDATEEDHDHDEDGETDEHVWLSLKNATIVCAYFADAISELDPDNADIYAANAQAYIASLEALDQAYETMVSEAARDTIIVTDRFPFLYLFTDYGIHYYAAFAGCSAETEASFETVVFLAEKAEEFDVQYLVIVENGLEELAATISSNTSNADQEVLVLNSLQSISQSDIDAGATYYSVMEENLEVLRLALAE